MRLLCAVLPTFLVSLAGAMPARAEDVAELPAVERLIEVLRSSAFIERQRVLDALAARPSLAEMYVPELRRALKDQDRAVRQQAALALAALGNDDKSVVTELIAGMARQHPGRYHSQPEDPLSAMHGLVKLEAKAVPALIAVLNDENYAGRWLAVKALGEIGPPAKEALPALAKAMAKQDDEQFTDMVETKWRIDRDSTSALRQLIPLLDDEKRGRSCDGAVRVLARMDADAKDAVPALITALQRYKDSNLLWALRELAPYSKELAIPALREALQEPTLADNAAIALQGLGEPAEKIVPHQLRRLHICKPNGGREPMQIVYTIATYGPAAKAYTPDLIRLLKHENPEVRRAAAWAVSRVGGDFKTVEAALLQLLPDAEVQEDAARSLKMLREAQ